MDFLTDLDTLRHNVLNSLYALLPSSLFSTSASLTKKDRYTLCGQFKKLERLIHSTNLQWWDKYFLEKYLENRISPRGLRITKTCSFLEPDQLKEWQGISEFGTAKWINILIEHRTAKFEKLTSRVMSLVTEIQKLDKILPTIWLDTLYKNTQREESLLIKNKLGKFSRDLNDYTKDRVYTWMQKPVAPPLITTATSVYRQHNTLSRSQSVALEPSDSGIQTSMNLSTSKIPSLLSLVFSPVPSTLHHRDHKNKNKNNNQNHNKNLFPVPKKN